MSPIPDPKAWDIDALNIDWTGLTAYPFPPSAHLHRVILNQAMQLSDHSNSPRLTRDALVLGPSAALNRDPTATPSVNNTPKTVPQLRVAHNPQLLNLLAWCLGVDNSKNMASLWEWQREFLHLSGHQQGPSTNQSGPSLKNSTENIRWISPLHL